MGQFWAIGQMLECGIAAVVLGDNPQANWRFYVAITALPAVLTIILVYFFMPESCRYLLVKGDEGNLMHSLKKAATMNGKAAELEALLNGK